MDLTQNTSESICCCTCRGKGGPTDKLQHMCSLTASTVSGERKGGIWQSDGTRINNPSKHQTITPGRSKCWVTVLLPLRQLSALLC